jgi:short-subunit dehydrogenase
MTTTIITGASSGIGAELARQLSAHGDDLALAARRTDRLEALRDEIVAAHPGRRVEVAALDVTDHEAVSRVFETFRAAYGTIDRVVVNAGIGKGAPIGTGRADANRETVATNVLGALAQCESAMEIFRAQRRGHLIVMSSFAALRGLPKSVTTYAATKAALSHLAEGIRAEMAGDPTLDITVTTLAPGFVESEMTARAGRTPLMTDTPRAVRGMVAAIEGKRAVARVPAWPWVPLAPVMRYLPLRLVAKLTR